MSPKEVGQHFACSQTFLSELLVFCERKSKWGIRSKKTKRFAQVAHDKWANEWPKRFSHSRSFVLSYISEQIAHYRSFYLSDMSEWLNEPWANELIPNPAACSISCIWIYQLTQFRWWCVYVLFIVWCMQAVQKELECPVCFEMMSRRTGRQPLSCNNGHSFCASCVPRWVITNRGRLGGASADS